MTAQTMKHRTPAILALSHILTALPHLPAADIEVGMVSLPEGLVLGLDIHLPHGHLADFEAWREALNLDPAAVVWRHPVAASYQVLRVDGEYAGVVVVLRAYAPCVEVAA